MPIADGTSPQDTGEVINRNPSTPTLDRLPTDGPICELHHDVWDQSNGNAVLHPQSLLRAGANQVK
jgi:hypothetical protein